MEFICSCNLSDIIKNAIKKRKHLEESFIWKILTQILIGLNYLHNKGIIHRDLKCENIFLCNLGIFKIAGFNGFCLLEKNN
jgi:serine/threonine protein kinase